MADGTREIWWDKRPGSAAQLRESAACLCRSVAQLRRSTTGPSGSRSLALECRRPGHPSAPTERLNRKRCAARGRSLVFPLFSKDCPSLDSSGNPKTVHFCQVAVITLPDE